MQKPRKIRSGSASAAATMTDKTRAAAHRQDARGRDPPRRHRQEVRPRRVRLSAIRSVCARRGKSRALERAFDTAIPAEVYDALEGADGGADGHSICYPRWGWPCAPGAVAVGEEPVGAAARGHSRPGSFWYGVGTPPPASVRRAYSLRPRRAACLCLALPGREGTRFGRALGTHQRAPCAP